MSLIPSFALAKALRDVERLKPTGDQMHDLVAEIRAWLDRVKFQRGEIIEAPSHDLAAFAKAGEPRPHCIEIVHDD